MSRQTNEKPEPIRVLSTGQLMAEIDSIHCPPLRAIRLRNQIGRRYKVRKHIEEPSPFFENLVRAYEDYSE